MADDILDQFTGFDRDTVLETINYCMKPALGGAVAGAIIGTAFKLGVGTAVGAAGGFVGGSFGCIKMAQLSGKLTAGLPMTEKEVLYAVSALQEY